MGGAVKGVEGSYISRYGRCCFEIWEVLFRDMGGAVLGGGGGHTFRDMGGAVSRYWRCCFEIWELLKSVLGGGFTKTCRNGGIPVSVRACGLSGPSSSLGPCSFFRFTECT